MFPWNIARNIIYYNRILYDLMWLFLKLNNVTNSG